MRRKVNTKDTAEDHQQKPDAKKAPEPPHSSQQMRKPHRTQVQEIKLFPLEISSSIELSTDSSKAKILRAIKEYKNREVIIINPSTAKPREGFEVIQYSEVFHIILDLQQTRCF